MSEREISSRRVFLKHATAAATGVALALHAGGAPAILPALGANEKIRVGFIGVGNRGSQLLGWFMQNPDVEVAALCDVYEPYLQRDPARVSERLRREVDQIPKMGEKFTGRVERYDDFRRLLDNKDIDAVVIATPDHWHAIQTIQACEAGKDVYCEKPLTITIREGRAMVDVARRTNRVVAVGLNRRGSTTYRELAQSVPAGLIGKVTYARAFRINNMFPDGIGNRRPEPPPPGFNWDMWLGPRAFRPYQFNIAPYKFRWWKDYSSQMGNWGVHYMDVIRWMLGEQAPVAISAHGGKFALKDDRTIPDTMEVTFEFKSGAIATFGIYEASGGGMIDGGEVELRGTKGNLLTDEQSYRVVPTRGGQFQNRGELVLATSRKLEKSENSSANVIRNFLDCVKSREKPFCDLEEGHRSTSFAHLANIALEVGQRLQWDAENERFLNSSEANKLLHYEYRKPWKLGNQGL